MTFYEILGLEPKATREEIKKAYRDLSKIYHTDVKDTGDAEKFKEISEAYETLYDESKREVYDSSQGEGKFDPTRNADIYSQVFSSDKHVDKKIRGTDRTATLKIKMEEAIQGVEKEIKFNIKQKCRSCKGKGKKLILKEGCEKCGGTKVIIEKTTNPMGVSVSSKFTCPSCVGVEDTYEPCVDCEGVGSLASKLVVPVTIPSGIQTGTVVRVKGQGNPGRNGGEPGSLLLKVEIEDDSPYRIVDGRLVMDLDVTFKQLVLGDRVELDVLGNKVYCNIPSYTQPNSVIEVRGTGYRLGSAATDAVLEVTLNLVIPQSVTPEQEALLQELNL